MLIYIGLAGGIVFPIALNWLLRCVRDKKDTFQPTLLMCICMVIIILAVC